MGPFGDWRRGETGATLVEILVATLLAALALGTLAMGISVVARTSSADQGNAQAAMVARSLEAVIQQDIYQYMTSGDCSAYPTLGAAVPSGYLATCGVQVLYDNDNDTDDVTNNNDTDPGDANDANNWCTPSGSSGSCKDSGLQQITVTVTVTTVNNAGGTVGAPIGSKAVVSFIKTDRPTT